MRLPFRRRLQSALMNNAGPAARAVDSRPSLAPRGRASRPHGADVLNLHSLSSHPRVSAMALLCLCIPVSRPRCLRCRARRPLRPRKRQTRRCPHCRPARIRCGCRYNFTVRSRSRRVAQRLLFLCTLLVEVLSAHERWNHTFILTARARCRRGSSNRQRRPR